MILPKREDAIHKMQLYRLLTVLIDTPEIRQNVIFKGGTCATMLGYLDRFSIDLDFDIRGKTNKKIIEASLQKVISSADLEIKEKSKGELFYLLKYQAKKGQRNTIKLSIMPHLSQFDENKPMLLSEIDRYAVCQTIETMFSHKLVALIDRFEKHNMIAGRDLYDMHHYFMSGYGYLKEIIVNRTGKTPLQYFMKLKKFLELHISDSVISEDLNSLLPLEKFSRIRKILKGETLMFISDEIRRLS